MCLIIYKPVGTELPKLDIITAATKRNPHGIGFMFPYEGKVVIHKGKITGELAHSMLKELDYGEDNWKSVPLIMHFRMATHGKVSDENCHPFPISADDKKLGATFCVTDIGLAHNGVIFMTGTNQHESDTYSFVKEYLSDFTWDTFSKVYKMLDEEVLKTDRLIVMNGVGDTIKWGTWSEYEGCLYSTYMSANVINNDANVYGAYGGYGYGGTYTYEDDYWTAEDYRKDEKDWNKSVTTATDLKFGNRRTSSTICDICNKDTRNRYYFREGIGMCYSCFHQFYMNGALKGETKKTIIEWKRTQENEYMETADSNVIDIQEMMDEVQSRRPIDGRLICDYCSELVPIDDCIVMEMTDHQVCCCQKCYNIHDMHIANICNDVDIKRMAVGMNMLLCK